MAIVLGRRPTSIGVEINLCNPLGTRLFNIDRTGTQCSLILDLTQPLLGGRPVCGTYLARQALRHTIEHHGSERLVCGALSFDSLAGDEGLNRKGGRTIHWR